MDFVENASFKSSGDICWPPWPSSLLDELSIDERDSDGFISRIVVCSSSDSSCNVTDSSQIIVGHQLRFLALLCMLCTKSADLACTWHYYLIACNPYNCILVVTLYTVHCQCCLANWNMQTNLHGFKLAIALTPRVLHYSASYYCQSSKCMPHINM